MRLGFPVFAAAVSIFSATAAKADEGFTPDFVAHDWRVEGGAVALSAAPLLGMLIPQSHHGGAPDAAHARNDGASTASDVVSFTGVGLMIAGATGSEILRDDEARWAHLRAALVVGEATLFGVTVTEIPKRLVGRCRPRDWNDAQQVCDPSAEKHADTAYAAFWSGTTAQIAAAAGAATCLALRDDHLGWPALVGALGQGAAIATGVLRVGAGAHSWTDVGAGFAAGNALGFAMCLLHPSTPRNGDVAIRLEPAPGGASLHVVF